MIGTTTKLMLSLCASICMLSSQGSFASEKIVGGEEAKIGEFPYIVSLHNARYSGHYCGGSLVRKNWVLTAGHCVSGVTPEKVFINFHKQSDRSQAESFNVLKVVRHPKYNSGNLDFDFALVQLASDSKMTPIEMNVNEINIPDTADGQLMATTLGWGVIKENGFSISDTLQKVSIPLVTKDACLASYPGKITDQMVCAGLTGGGKDSCQGDSGGPLVFRENGKPDMLIGVVSWGIGCARPNKYGVYAKLNVVIEWINENTAQ